MSWKQLFSSRLTNVVAADFTNPIDSVEQGNATVPAVENMLAARRDFFKTAREAQLPL